MKSQASTPSSKSNPPPPPPHTHVQQCQWLTPPPPDSNLNLGMDTCRHHDGNGFVVLVRHHRWPWQVNACCNTFQTFDWWMALHAIGFLVCGAGMLFTLLGMLQCRAKHGPLFLGGFAGLISALLSFASIVRVAASPAIQPHNWQYVWLTPTSRCVPVASDDVWL